MPLQINDIMSGKLQEIYDRIQSDCNQMMTPISDEQFRWRKDIYDMICKYKPRFRAILEGESLENIGVVNEDTGTGTSDHYAEAGSTGEGSDQKGNVGESNAGEGMEDTESLFV